MSHDGDPKPGGRGRPVIETRIALVEVIAADRDELRRGLYTQGYSAERATELARSVATNDGALQMLARHRLASIEEAERRDAYAEPRMTPKLDRPMRRIPIKAARAIADTYGYDQVVIYGRRVGESPAPYGEHVTTYGVDRTHCDVAALMGRTLKRIMGWDA